LEVRKMRTREKKKKEKWKGHRPEALASLGRDVRE